MVNSYLPQTMKWKKAWQYYFRKFFLPSKPVMIGGYRSADGRFHKHTRISSSTYIGNHEKFFTGDHVFIGHFNMLDASNELHIEEGCQLTNFISILTHSSHHSIRLYGSEYISHSRHKGYVTGSVHIGKFSFIGPHVTIMPGTVLGKGSLVSAYSYVKGSFPDFAILAGNPATVTGDTRDLDDALLKENPDLLPFYQQWSK
jgi:acetyltransferase-like isoleucine patch superfamily enzyme